MGPCANDTEFCNNYSKTIELNVCNIPVLGKSAPPPHTGEVVACVVTIGSFIARNYFGIAVCGNRMR